MTPLEQMRTEFIRWIRGKRAARTSKYAIPESKIRSKSDRWYSPEEKQLGQIAELLQFRAASSNDRSPASRQMLPSLAQAERPGGFHRDSTGLRPALSRAECHSAGAR